jgi:hypothetical protein
MTTTTIEIEAIVLRPAEDITPSTAANIAAQFGGFYEQAEAWRQKALSIKVENINDTENIAAAREARLALKNIRVGAEKTRKAMKEDSLRYGRAVDGAYNMLEHVVKPLEAHLEEQERIAERLEAERLRNLREVRAARLREADPDHIHGVDLATYFDDQFEKVLADVRDLRTLRIQREAAEEEARQKRIQEEEAERRRIQEENERLRAEAAKAEAALQEERKRIALEHAEAVRIAAQERAKAEAKARKERELAEAAAAAERKKREAAEREAAALRAKQETLERVLAMRDKLAAEAAAKAAAKAEKARLDAEKKAAAAPDKAKLLEFAATVRALTVPQMKTENGQVVRNDVQTKAESFARWIEAQAQTL